MPTPAAGSELRTAMTTTPEVTLSAGVRRAAPRRASSTPPGRRGGCGPRRCSRSAPRAPGPALRRGALVAVPVGALAGRRARLRRADQGRDRDRRPARRLPRRSTPRPGRAPPGRRRRRRRSALAAGARRPQQPVGADGGRWRWAWSAPLPATASPSRCGWRSSASRSALALVIAQGLFLAADDALPALLYGTVGGLLQALWSLLVWVVVDRCRRGRAERLGRRRAVAAACART